LAYQQLRTIVYDDNMSGNESSGDSDECAGLENNDGHAPNVRLPEKCVEYASRRYKSQKKAYRIFGVTLQFG
jgi:hypothetical protein